MSAASLTFIVSDVSFITLKLALAPALDLQLNRVRPPCCWSAGFEGRPRGDPARAAC